VECYALLGHAESKRMSIAAPSVLKEEEFAVIKNRRTLPNNEQEGRQKYMVCKWKWRSSQIQTQINTNIQHKCDLFSGNSYFTHIWKSSRDVAQVQGEYLLVLPRMLSWMPLLCLFGVICLLSTLIVCVLEDIMLWSSE
jgi:hypothetical protein